MNRPIRIVHVVQNLNYGGMEKVLADLVCGTDQSRFDSHVLTLEYLGRYSRDMEGCATLHRSPEMSKLSLLWPAALVRCLRELNPDIVHTHSGVWYKTSLASRLARVPAVVHTEHGRPPGDRLSHFLSRRAARRTDTVVAVSQALATFLVDWLAVAPNKVRVVRNGVHLARFRPRTESGKLRQELGLTPEQPIVGSIGRLEPVKGYEVVIRAFARVPVPATAARPVLVVAGEGSARAELEALVARLGLNGRVFLLGWRDDSEDLYAHFSCFVLGSWSEGTSVSLLEAMASGLAPVVTDVGGNAAVLGDGLASQLVAPGDPAGMGRAIEALMTSQTRKVVGAAARRRVEREFDLAAMIREYEKLYLEVASMA